MFTPNKTRFLSLFLVFLAITMMAVAIPVAKAGLVGTDTIYMGMFNYGATAGSWWYIPDSTHAYYYTGTWRAYSGYANSFNLGISGYSTTMHINVPDISSGNAGPSAKIRFTWRYPLPEWTEEYSITYGGWSWVGIPSHSGCRPNGYEIIVRYDVSTLWWTANDGFGAVIVEQWS